AGEDRLLISRLNIDHPSNIRYQQCIARSNINKEIDFALISDRLRAMLQMRKECYAIGEQMSSLFVHATCNASKRRSNTGGRLPVSDLVGRGGIADPQSS